MLRTVFLGIFCEHPFCFGESERVVRLMCLDFFHDLLRMLRMLLLLLLMLLRGSCDLSLSWWFSAGWD